MASDLLFYRCKCDKSDYMYQILVCITVACGAVTILYILNKNLMPFQYILSTF